MLSPEEILLLESLLARARAEAERAAVRLPADAFIPGDIVQLRPGADPHWQTSLVLVSKIRDDGGVSGQILRPHRGGFPETWYTYRPPSLVRIGRMLFRDPGPPSRSPAYMPPCPSCHNPAAK